MYLSLHETDGSNVTYHKYSKHRTPKPITVIVLNMKELGQWLLCRSFQSISPAESVTAVLLVAMSSSLRLMSGAIFPPND